MGPTFVKLGQVLATRVDLLPPPYLVALERLQDKVEPFPIAQVEAIIECELGVRISKAFSEFEPTPIAAASLGQVHRAALRDGRRVVVKVQRPGVHETLADDLAALEEAASLLDAHTKVGQRYQFRSLVAEFKKSLPRELDYQEEARNLQEGIGVSFSPYRGYEVGEPGVPSPGDGDRGGSEPAGRSRAAKERVR